MPEPIKYTVQIRNMRNGRPKHEWHEVVDRSSILGNPYKMLNEDFRDEVCEDYEAWFKRSIALKSDVYHEVLRLHEIGKQYGKLYLFCWCAPKRCHAITIMNYLLQLQEEEEKQHGRRKGKKSEQRSSGLRNRNRRSDNNNE